jgi:hypothetical protein
VRQSGVPCIVYLPDRSYVQSGSFLQVWNHSTPQWDDIHEEYDACGFPVARRGVSQFSMSDRGNRSISLGFTGMSYQPDPATFVQKPVMRDETLHWKKHMQSLSSLQAACGARPPPEDHRFRDFGRLIHPDNFLEGITVGVTDLLTENVSCHLDTQNDRSTGFNTVIVASEIKDGERLIQGGYFKSCVFAYCSRQQVTCPVIASASVLFGEIVEWENRNHTIHHHNKPGQPPACIDKCVRLAPFVHILVDLIRTFRLNFVQTIEALLPITFVTASVYWVVGSQWIQSKKLPAPNLARAFHDIATTNAKNSELTLSLPPIECLEASLYHLRHHIQAVNSCDTNRHSYHHLVLEIQKTCGQSGSVSMLPIEDLVTVAVLAGVITHSKLANQACLSRSTPTLLAIKSTSDCTTISQACGLVKAVARALDVSLPVSHALFRQKLNLDQSYLTSYCDVHEFSGLTIFRAGDSGITRSVPIVPKVDFGPTTNVPWFSRKTTKPSNLLSRSTHMEGSARSGLVTCKTIKITKPRNLLSRSTRSSTWKLPQREVVLSTVIPWAEVVLLRDASEQVCIHPALDGSRITFHEEVQSPGGRVFWRATCQVNEVTWNPNDNVTSCAQSEVSGRFGGLAHSCYHPRGGGCVVYNSKNKAGDSLLVYMLVYGDNRSFRWVRRTLGDHHFIPVRKKGNSSSADPLFLIYRHKGYIFIGHFKDSWRTRTKLCRV